MNSRPFDPTVISPVAWGQGTSTTRHGVHQKTLTGISETSHFRRLFTEAQATPQSRLLYKGNRRLISPRGHEGSNGSNYANIKDIGSLVSPVAWSRRRIVSRPKNDILLGDYKSNDQGVLNNYNNVENLPSKTPMKMSEDKGDSGISFGKFVKGGDYKSKLIIRNGDNMNNGTIRVLRPAMKRMGNKENTISEIPKVEKGLVHIDKFYSPREPNYRVFLNQ